jgi:hypothetical protein
MGRTLIETGPGFAVSGWLGGRVAFWLEPPFIFAELGSAVSGPRAATHLLALLEEEEERQRLGQEPAMDMGITTWAGALGLFTDPTLREALTDLSEGGISSCPEVLQAFLDKHFKSLSIMNAVSENHLKVGKRLRVDKYSALGGAQRQAEAHAGL